jgi:hypothetical protein
MEENLARKVWKEEKNIHMKWFLECEVRWDWDKCKKREQEWSEEQNEQR